MECWPCLTLSVRLLVVMFFWCTKPEHAWLGINESQCPSRLLTHHLPSMPDRQLPRRSQGCVGAVQWNDARARSVPAVACDVHTGALDLFERSHCDSPDTLLKLCGSLCKRHSAVQRKSVSTKGYPEWVSKQATDVLRKARSDEQNCKTPRCWRMRQAGFATCLVCRQKQRKGFVPVAQQVTAASIPPRGTRLPKPPAAMRLASDQFVSRTRRRFGIEGAPNGMTALLSPASALAQHRLEGSTGAEVLANGMDVTAAAVDVIGPFTPRTEAALSKLCGGHLREAPPISSFQPGAPFVEECGGSVALYITGGLLSGCSPERLLALASMHGGDRERDDGSLTEVLKAVSSAVVSVATKYLGALPSPDFMQSLKGRQCTGQEDDSLNRLTASRGLPFGAPAATTAERLRSCVRTLVQFWVTASRLTGSQTELARASAVIIAAGRELLASPSDENESTVLRVFSATLLDWCGSRDAVRGYLQSLVPVRGQQEGGEPMMRLATSARVAQLTAALLQVVQLCVGGLRACLGSVDCSGAPAYLRSPPRLTVELPGCAELTTWLRLAKEVSRAETNRSMSWMVLDRRQEDGVATSYLVDGVQIFVADPSALHDALLASFWETLAQLFELAGERASDLKDAVQLVRDGRRPFVVLSGTASLDITVEGSPTGLKDLAQRAAERGLSAWSKESLASIGALLGKLADHAKVLLYLGSSLGARGTEIDQARFPVHHIPLKGSYQGGTRRTAGGQLGRAAVTLETSKHKASNPFRLAVCTEDASQALLVYASVVRGIILEMAGESEGVSAGAQGCSLPATLFLPPQYHHPSAKYANNSTADLLRQYAAVFLGRDVKISALRTVTDAHLASTTSSLSEAELAVWDSQARSKGHSARTLIQTYLATAPSLSSSDTANDLHYCLRIQHVFKLGRDEAVVPPESQSESLVRADGQPAPERGSVRTVAVEEPHHHTSFKDASHTSTPSSPAEVSRPDQGDFLVPGGGCKAPAIFQQATTPHSGKQFQQSKPTDEAASTVEEQCWSRCIGPPPPGLPSSSARSHFRPCQREALRLITNGKSCLFLGDVGLGKTACWFAPSFSRRLLRIPVATTVIVAPLRSLVAQHAQCAIARGLSTVVVGRGYGSDLPCIVAPKDLVACPEILVLSAEYFLNAAWQRWLANSVHRKEIATLVIDEVQEYLLSASWRPLLATITGCMASLPSLDNVSRMAASGTITPEVQARVLATIAFPPDTTVLRCHWPQRDTYYQVDQAQSLTAATETVTSLARGWFIGEPMEAIVAAVLTSDPLVLPGNCQVLIFAPTYEATATIAAGLNEYLYAVLCASLADDGVEVDVDELRRRLCELGAPMGLLAAPCSSQNKGDKDPLLPGAVEVEQALMSRRLFLSVCTARLAQGFDCSTISRCVVLHANCLADLVQMFGRCGRGGLPAEARLLSTPFRLGARKHKSAIPGLFYEAEGVKDLILTQACLRLALYERLHAGEAMSCSSLEGATL